MLIFDWKKKRVFLKIFFLLCFALLISESFAGTVPISKFLLSAWNDSSLMAQQEKVDFLEDSYVNMPVIDDIEFRIRNKAYRFDRQRYTLRVEPRGFGETKASRSVYNNRLKLHKHKLDLYTNRLLKDRYLLVLEYMYSCKILGFYREMALLYNDKINVYKKLKKTMMSDLNNLLNSEDKYTKLKFDNIDRERKIKRLQKEISACLEQVDFTEVDTSDIIDAEFVNNFIKEKKLFLDTNNVYLKDDRLRFHLAESRYTLENAIGRQYINFLEFSYDHGERLEELDKQDEGKNFDLNRAFIMQLGVRLPFVNIDRHDINRRKLAYLSDRRNYVKKKASHKARLKKDLEDISILVTQYNFLQSRKSDVNATSSLKKYIEMEGINPDILLSIKESIIENDMDIEKIKFDILRNYIRILDITGLLSKKPLRNYLSTGQEVIAK